MPVDHWDVECHLIDPRKLSKSAATRPAEYVPGIVADDIQVSRSCRVNAFEIVAVNNVIVFNDAHSIMRIGLLLHMYSDGAGLNCVTVQLHFGNPGRCEQHLLTY